MYIYYLFYFWDCWFFLLAYIHTFYLPVKIYNVLLLNFLYIFYLPWPPNGSVCAWYKYNQSWKTFCMKFEIMLIPGGTNGTVKWIVIAELVSDTLCSGDQCKYYPHPFTASVYTSVLFTPVTGATITHTVTIVITPQTLCKIYIYI